jgi:hypothetical protein
MYARKQPLLLCVLCGPYFGVGLGEGTVLNYQPKLSYSLGSWLGGGGDGNLFWDQSNSSVTWWKHLFY